MPMASTTTTTTSRPPATLAVRVLLTLVGAAGLIVGALLDWFSGFEGTKIKYNVLYAKNPGLTDTFVISVGFIVIALACLAILGLAARSGWLTSLAGALGVVVFILFTVNVYRNSDLTISDYKIGVWLVLAGAIVAIVAGFFGRRRTVVVTAPAAESAPPPPPPPP
jgi:hypothetical protein